MKPIKLGKEMPDCPCPMTSAKEEKKEMYYPGLYLEDVDTRDWPTSGTLTARFRIRRKTDDLKEDKICTDIELLEITDVAGKTDRKPEAEERDEEFEKTAKKVIEDAGEDY